MAKRSAIPVEDGPELEIEAESAPVNKKFVPRAIMKDVSATKTSKKAPKEKSEKPSLDTEELSRLLDLSDDVLLGHAADLMKGSEASDRAIYALGSRTSAIEANRSRIRAAILEILRNRSAVEGRVIHAIMRLGGEKLYGEAIYNAGYLRAPSSSSRGMVGRGMVRVVKEASE